jgi:dTDP-4-amino-4,6-dideoxygalactose transaminase
MSWVAHKAIDDANVRRLLENSFENKHFTNYGPAVRRLETKLRTILQINEDRALIVTNSGAHALHAVVDALRLATQKPLLFATQDFTFPTALQGPLKGSRVVDVTDDMQFDLSQLTDDVDGVVVTNLFGHCCDIDRFVALDKFVIFDNATCPLTKYRGVNVNNFGTAAIVSLHHTKPLGFGEGGVIVIEKRYEDIVRGVMNFGYMSTGPRKWHSLGNNYKMSDVSAAYIDDFLDRRSAVYDHHRMLYSHFLARARDVPQISLFPDHSSEMPLVSCIPFFLPFDTTDLIQQINAVGIEARQYYPSLTGLPVASQKFLHIVCLPCNPDITTEHVDVCIQLIMAATMG